MLQQYSALFLLCILFTLPASGQRLIDEETGKPVADAFVKIYDGEWAVQTSDARGSFAPSHRYPQVVWVSHLNYAPRVDTLKSPEETPKSWELQPTSHPLQEVVITGQYEPQSAENSVYKIRSISSREILQRGATTLTEVLNTSLNLRLQNDPATGASGLSMQGISGENVKVLIDGIPLVGKVGNQVDLGQLDITQIQKIEIVEGPMAVSYGSNAMGGVINIITKKGSQHEWFVGASLNEETVGSSYGADQGIHNQFVNGGARIAPLLYTQGSFSHKYFGGYKTESNTRSHTWNPKTQWIANALLRFTPGKWNTFYKVDFLNETIDSYGEPTGIFDPLAIDEKYTTYRVIHQFQASTPLSGNSRLNMLFAYTDYNRTKNQFVTQLATGEKQLSQASGSQDTTTFRSVNFRGNYLKVFEGVSLELGYDANLDRGQGGRIERSATKRIDDIGLFATAEFNVGNIAVKPGLRGSWNSHFPTPVIPSLNLKWAVSELWKLRAGYGRGFRAPTLKERYFEFVDSSHRIYGNPDLLPEDGHHVDATLTYTPKSTISFDADLFYNRLTNQIGFGLSPTDPTITTYVNIDDFQSIGANLGTTYATEHATVTLGAGVIGRRSSDGNTGTDGLLYSPEFIANGTFALTSKLRGGIYYKYTGKVPQYVLGENQELVLTSSEDFHWMDINASYTFSPHITLTGGIKNVLDVTSVQSGQGGGHAGSSRFVGYGRSLFLKLDLMINAEK